MSLFCPTRKTTGTATASAFRRYSQPSTSRSCMRGSLTNASPLRRLSGSGESTSTTIKPSPCRHNHTNATPSLILSALATHEPPDLHHASAFKCLDILFRQPVAVPFPPMKAFPRKPLRPVAINPLRIIRAYEVHPAVF
jgi:hypothetical protein